MHHELNPATESSVGILPLYKTLAGTLLLTIGVILGIYVAITAFGLIRGQEPPGLVKQFAAQANAFPIAAPDGNGQPTFRVPPDVMRAFIYLLTCLLLSLPALIASAFVNAGTRLMQDDTAQLLQKLTQKIGELPTRKR